MNIYVGNLSYQTNEEQLGAAFASYGEVATVSIVRDRFSNQSKGFGFVEMADAAQAQAAIDALNGAEMQGRQIRVNEARPRGEREERGGSRGGGGRDRY